MSSRRFVAAGVIGVLVAMTGFGAVVSANHAWGSYHWARKTASFDLTVINSTTADWDPFVAMAVTDWSQAEPLNLIEDPNGSTSDRDRRQCRAPSGMVRICNLAYGYTGWLGIAGISIDADGHIFTGYTKLNDSYFSSSYYSTNDWKQSVTCQELGHNVGLDHQDEDFNSPTPLLSCMDYQDPPFPYANAHDFEQLKTIYAHLDSYDSYASGGSGGGSGTCTAPPGKGCNKSGVGHSNDHSGWGLSLGRRGANERFIRVDADGTRHVTFVTWAAGH